MWVLPHPAKRVLGALTRPNEQHLTLIRRIERDGARDLIIHGGICRWERRNPHR